MVFSCNTDREAAKMRVVMLLRHYPPAVSGGARRPALFAKGLRALGFEVAVVAPNLPEGEPGLAVPHPNRDPPVGGGPVRRGWRDHARELLLWPDPDIRWTMRAAKAAAQALPAPDWLITSAPPESIHAAGFWLQQNWRCRWLGDFRDTWLVRPHRQERRVIWRAAGERLLAQRYLSAMDAVTAVDPVVAAEMARLGGRKVEVIGHAAPDLPAPAALPAETINVVHAGQIALSSPQSRIEDVLAPFAAARAENPALALHLVGRLNTREIAAAGAVSGVTLHGVKSATESLAMIAGADGLALVSPPDLHVPASKIVEYLATGLPIAACGDGPWRTDPRVPKQAARDVMAHLVKHPPRFAQGLPKPPTGAEVSRQLAQLLTAKGD
jgi:glycosyltransferase involved in cell wall biosynthesis